MTHPKLSLLKSLKVLFSRLFSGRIHFLKDQVGKILLMHSCQVKNGFLYAENHKYSWYDIDRMTNIC
jgi:hypothetical protein